MILMIGIARGYVSFTSILMVIPTLSSPSVWPGPPDWESVDEVDGLPLPHGSRNRPRVDLPDRLYRILHECWKIWQ